MAKLLIATTVSSTLRAFLLPFARHFSARGWRVDAMAFGVSGCEECIEAFDRVWDIEWSRNPLDPRNHFSARRAIQEVVVREKYDIVHVHTPVASFVTRYALRTLKRDLNVKVIYTAHGFHFHSGERILKNWIFFALEKAASQWTDYLIVINKEDERLARHHTFLPDDRIVYMPGIGVDTGSYKARPTVKGEVEGVRQSLGLDPDDLIFLLIGEFIERKRHCDALRAFAKLPYPNAHILFAGEGPLLADVRGLAASLKIPGRVHFLGFRDDIPSLISISDAVLLVSSQEGLPRSVMESMSVGVPVIGTDIRGTSELLADNFGILVPVGDIARIAEAMAWIAGNPAEASAMGRRGRVKVKSNFGVDLIIRMHEQLYQSCLGTRIV